jgi:hypothetical protein
MWALLNPTKNQQKDFFSKRSRFLRKGLRKWLKRTTFGTILKMMAAKVFPFKMWALLNPTKNQQKDFLIDEKGEMIVNYTGLYENLQVDFNKIVEEIGLEVDHTDLPLKNKSKRVKDYSAYFNGALFYRLFYRKIQEDLKLYDSLKNQK